MKAFDFIKILLNIIIMLFNIDNIHIKFSKNNIFISQVNLFPNFLVILIISFDC
mgnify:CR=1 FL=1|jgi:hypothetical protein